jgi:hypothetical protein
VIPDVVELKLTVRAYLPEVRDTLRRRVTELAEQTAAAFGARAEIEFPRGFPSVINHPQQTAYIRDVAVQGFGSEQVVPSSRRARPARTSLPAAGAAREFRVRRQRRQRTVAQPALCVQRRRHRTRRQPVGAAGRRLSGEGRGMSSNERFLYTSVDDPLARPLFDGLEQEYDSRYADVRRRIGGSAREELQRYPAQAFAARR